MCVCVCTEHIQNKVHTGIHTYSQTKTEQSNVCSNAYMTPRGGHVRQKKKVVERDAGRAAGAEQVRHKLMLCASKKKKRSREKRRERSRSRSKSRRRSRSKSSSADEVCEREREREREEGREEGRERRRETRRERDKKREKKRERAARE